MLLNIRPKLEFEVLKKYLKKWLWIVPEIPLDIHLTPLALAQVVVTVEDDVRLRARLHGRRNSHLTDLNPNYA